MTSRQPIIRLLIVLCAFAVLGAQVFGLARGFSCDCGGTQRIVKTDGCNGPHGANCHADDSQQQPGSHDDGGGDRKQHTQVKENLTGTNVTVPPVVIPAPVILAVLPEFLALLQEPPVASLDYLSDVLGGPPLSIAVARTVVLRI